MFNEPDQRLAPTAHAAPTLGGWTPRPLRVGMIGLGTVGLGTAQVLRRNQALIAARAGRPVVLTQVAVRNVERARSLLGPEVHVTANALAVATHPDVDVVVEVAGGTGPARDWVLAAIAQGKHVVSANKALLAEHGAEIFGAAQQQGVALAYEGAVAVSIPIIKALREGLVANDVQWVAGIINGTTNFILSKMETEGLTFNAALAQAQALGYAEADPTLDVQGGDAAHKLTLLAANAFGMPPQFADVQVQGITGVHALDTAGARQLGYRIKLLSMARRVPGGDAVELRVQPALVPATHLLAQVNGSMNAVMVYGDACGPTLYYGAGAGSETTGSAVIADLVDVARLDGTHPAQRVPHLSFAPQSLRARPVVPHGEVQSAHFLRLPLRVPAPGTAAPTAREALEVMSALLAGQGVAVERIEWLAGHTPAEPQALVLTGVLPQAVVEQALQAAQAHPLVAGPCAQWRVETLEG